MPTQLPQSQINALDTACPQRTRLLIARDLTNENEVLAINLTTKEQVGVCTQEAYNFFPDCVGIDAADAEQYSNGQPIQTLMSEANWNAWVEGCAFAADPAFVWLTVSKEEGAINALCLANTEEVLAPFEQKPYLFPDLIGFVPERFEQGYGVPCRMTSANWIQWRVQFGCDGSMTAEEIIAALEAA